MAESFDTIYFRGQGKLFIGLRNTDGTNQGLTFIGDIEIADGTPNVEREQVIENVTGSSSIAAEFIKKTEYTLNIAARSVKPAHLALLLQASNTTRTGGSTTDEPIKARLGKMVALPHNKVSSVTVTDVAGTNTYTTPDDYIVHADEGLIEFTAGGSTTPNITDGDTVHVDYTYATQNQLKANPQNQEYVVVFAGKNVANNSKQCRCTIHRVKLSPAILGFIQQNVTNFPITGIILQDSNRPAGDQFFTWDFES